MTTQKDKDDLMHTLKKLLIYVGILFIIGAGCTYQCTADDRRREKRYNDNKNEEQMRDADIQKAIDEGDFARARTRAAEMTDIFEKEKQKKAYENITLAQVAFLINNDNIEQAYSISQEENRIDNFFESFLPKISDIYDNLGKIKTTQYLAKVEFDTAPNLSANQIYGENEEYNKSATKFNTLLEQFIIYVDIKGDKEYASQLLKFVKPIVVELPGNYAGVKLSTQPQVDMKKKLGL